MLEQLRAAIVDLRGRGIALQLAAGELVREVLSGVQVLEEAGDGLEVVVFEVDATVWRRGLRRDGADEERRLYQQGLMRCEFGLGVVAADEEGDDWVFEEAGGGRCGRLARFFFFFNFLSFV